MKKNRLLFLCISLLLCMLFVGCTEPYHADHIIGKTALEIAAEYGAFDCTMMPPGEDGLYRSCACGYTIREPRVGFLGTSPEVLFFISFDADGIARACFEGNCPGG